LPIAFSPRPGCGGGARSGAAGALACTGGTASAGRGGGARTVTARAARAARIARALALAAALLGCASGGSAIAGEGAIEDVEWRLLRLADGPVAIARGAGAPSLLLESASRRATGSGGCNRFTGPYERDGASLRFGALAATKMACDGMEVETAYFGTLERTRSWRRDGDRLELLDERGALLAVLAPAVAR